MKQLYLYLSEVELVLISLYCSLLVVSQWNNTTSKYCRSLKNSNISTEQPLELHSIKENRKMEEMNNRND